MYIKIPRIYGYVTLYSRRDFTVVLKVTDLKIEISSWIISLSPV